MDYEQAKTRREQLQAEFQELTEERVACARRGHHSAELRKRDELNQLLANLVEAAREEGIAAMDPAALCEQPEPEPVTVMALATHRLGRPATSGADYEEAGVPMIGGCQTCGATVAAYNSHPTKTGYISCRDCMTPALGWPTAEEAWAAMEADDDQEAVASHGGSE